MRELKKYAVLQFVEQKSSCHMIHDTIVGNTLMEYAKNKVVLEKGNAFRIAQSLAEQLEQFYKCEDQDAYGYITPYAVVVNEEGEARLLDIWAEENKDHLMKMKKKKVRVLFISPTYVLSQKRRREDDWFGYGKTVQFLMEKCCDTTALAFSEKNNLSKLYIRCQNGDKAAIEGWRWLQEFLQKTLKNNERRKKLTVGRPILLLASATFIVGFFIGTQFYEQEEPVIIEKVVEVPAKEEEEAQSYTRLLELILKEELSVKEKEKLKDEIELIARKKEMDSGNWFFQKCLAMAYEKLEKYEAAIVEYEEVRKKVGESAELKYIYQKLIELYNFVDLPEKEKELYVEAVECFPELAKEK